MPAVIAITLHPSSAIMVHALHLTDPLDVVGLGHVTEDPIEDVQRAVQPVEKDGPSNQTGHYNSSQV